MSVRRRGVTTAVVLLAVIVAGAVARLPAPPPDGLRLELPVAPPADAAPVVTRGLLARPIDPFTLADVPGRFMPVDVGWAAASDDGRLLALPSADRATVLERDTFAVIAVVQGDLPSDLRFSPEHDALVGTSFGSVLVRRPLDPAAPGTRMRLPWGLAAAAAVPLTGGRIAALAVPVGVARRTDATPRAVVADLVAERLVLDLPLPALAGVEEPSIAWDPLRERLFAGASDAGRLVAVDLGAGAVAADVLLPAVAGSRLRLLAVPGGGRLYAGTERELLVLSAADLALQRRLPMPALHLAASRDGHWLAVGGDDGVHVLDGRTLGEAGHLAPGARARAEFGRAPDLLYLRLRDVGGTLVQAVTLPRLEVRGERRQEAREHLDVAGGLRFLPL